MTRQIALSMLMVLVLVGTAAAQTPATTVRVNVREAGTQRPIVGAEIQLTGPPSCFDSHERFSRACMDLFSDLPDNEEDLLIFLQRVSNRAPSSVVPVAMTDADGSVVFRNVEPGHYAIRARRNGYVSQVLVDADSPANPALPESPSQQLILHEKQLNHEVSLSMTPTASIRGRVLDASGRPVIDARLVLGTTNSDTGPRTFLARTSVMTNEAGEFTFTLAPGYYALRLHPPGYPATPVYFPGETELAKAAAIHLDAGRNVNGIDIKIR